MKIDPFSSIPIGSLHKLNWFEGFRRIKKVLEVGFVLAVVCLAWIQITGKPYYQIEKKADGFLVTRFGKSFSFPPDASEKEIERFLKKEDGTNFWAVTENALLGIPVGILVIEICFWIPVYVAKGFGKPND